MFANFWGSSLFRNPSRRPRRTERAFSPTLRASRARPSLEMLEDRLVMDTTGTVGGGLPLDITPASLPVHYIISVSGAMYPSANTTSSGAGQGPLLGEIRMFAGTQAPQGWAFCDGQVLPINANQALFTLLGNTYGGSLNFSFALPDLRGRIASGVGAGLGLPAEALGASSGAETVTLSLNQIPFHVASLPAGGLTGPAGGSQPFFASAPSLGLNYIIAEEGNANALGEIRLFAGNFAPGGWAFCDGQVIPIATNTALFTTIGASFGGDGRNTFGLPDLQGRAPRGLQFATDLGAQVGFHSITLLNSQLPAHTFPLPSGGTTGSVGQDQPFDYDQPALGIQYIIALTGTYQSTGSSGPVLGQIMPFAGVNIPAGWAACNGQLLPIAPNAALFSVLLNEYGGDGKSNFALPDLRGRVAVEAGQGAWFDAARSGEGIRQQRCPGG